MPPTIMSTLSEMTASSAHAATTRVTTVPLQVKYLLLPRLSAAAPTAILLLLQLNTTTTTTTNFPPTPGSLGKSATGGHCGHDRVR